MFSRRSLLLRRRTTSRTRDLWLTGLANEIRFRRRSKVRYVEVFRTAVITAGVVFFGGSASLRIGTAEVGRLGICPLEAGLRKAGAYRARELQIGVSQVRAAKICSVKAHSGEIGVLEVAFHQNGAGKIGTTEISSAKRTGSELVIQVIFGVDLASR